MIMMTYKLNDLIKKYSTFWFLFVHVIHPERKLKLKLTSQKTLNHLRYVSLPLLALFFFMKSPRISLIFETSVLGKPFVTVAANERKRRLNGNK